ncbi:hypothetical protein IP88_16405 [alpha proteobacterium AAP81b]|nr:hypothetical protein IP88_16405 [alpha proteobacterium AAP81b]
MSGLARLRVETLADGLRPGAPRDETVVMSRVTLMADIGDGPVHVIGEIWDSRVFNIRADRSGASLVGANDINTLEPVQLHVRADLGAPFGKGSHAVATFGRMVLNLGSRRIIAADDYRNTTNGYTGLRLDLTPVKDVEATFVYTLPQQRLPDAPTRVQNSGFALDRENFALQLWGGIALWRHAAGNLNLELSGFQLSERDTPQLATRDRNLATIDMRGFVPPAAGHFDIEVEGAWQWGRSRPGTSNAVPRAEVEAWYLHADTGYTFRGPWHPRLSAEFDVVSGDRPGGKYTRFDTIFGMRRADFSPGSILGYIGRANLLAPGLRLEVEPGPRTDGFASVRAMWAESRSDVFSQTGIRDASGQSGRFAGWELDSRVRHWLIQKRLRGEIDTVVFLRRGLLRDAPNAPPGGTVVYFSASVIAPF